MIDEPYGEGFVDDFVNPPQVNVHLDISERDASQSEPLAQSLRQVDAPTYSNGTVAGDETILLCHVFLCRDGSEASDYISHVTNITHYQS